MHMARYQWSLHSASFRNTSLVQLKLEKDSFNIIWILLLMLLKLNVSTSSEQDLTAAKV